MQVVELIGERYSVEWTVVASSIFSTSKRNDLSVINGLVSEGLQLQHCVDGEGIVSISAVYCQYETLMNSASTCRSALDGLHEARRHCSGRILIINIAVRLGWKDSIQKLLIGDKLIRRIYTSPSRSYWCGKQTSSQLQKWLMKLFAVLSTTIAGLWSLPASSISSFFSWIWMLLFVCCLSWWIWSLENILCPVL